MFVTAQASAYMQFKRALTSKNFDPEQKQAKAERLPAPALPRGALGALRGETRVSRREPVATVQDELHDSDRPGRRHKAIRFGTLASPRRDIRAGHAGPL